MLEPSQAADLRTQVREAIVAHGLWKSRMLEALETGKAAIMAGAAGSDRECPLGRWMQGGMNDAPSALPHLSAVREAHARLHAEAAELLELAGKGSLEEVRARTAAGGSFTRTSVALTRELMAWMQDLPQAA